MQVQLEQIPCSDDPYVGLQENANPEEFVPLLYAALTREDSAFSKEEIVESGASCMSQKKTGVNIAG